MFQAKKLSYERGGRLLFSELSFFLESGQALQIKGENGSGKSSLLKLLTGLDQPDQGELFWNKQALTGDQQNDFYQNLLFIGHKSGLNAHLNAQQNLAWYCDLNALSITNEQQAQIFKQWGLYGFEDIPAKQLSAGQQRKIALCRLSVEPKKLWLLDEPLVSLDKNSIGIFTALLNKHLETGGMAIFTSHQDLSLNDKAFTVLDLSRYKTSLEQQA